MSMRAKFVEAVPLLRTERLFAPIPAKRSLRSERLECLFLSYVPQLRRPHSKSIFAFVSRIDGGRAVVLARSRLPAQPFSECRVTRPEHVCWRSEEHTSELQSLT